MLAAATRTTAAMVATATRVATMTPNGNKDIDQGNSKNYNKATTTPTTTTEGGEHCQSRRDNCGGGHRRPRDAFIATL
jgi:hypothetical protein